MSDKKLYTPEIIELLEKLHRLSEKTGIGYSMVYEECADTWYYFAISAVPSEKFVGKSRSMFENAITDVIEFLEQF